MGKRVTVMLFALGLCACGARTAPSMNRTWDGNSGEPAASVTPDSAPRANSEYRFDADAGNAGTIVATSQRVVVDRKSTVPGLKVAFFGDQGVGAGARGVLQLVADEHADAIIHLGDFAYEEASPSGWDAQINEVLGSDYPYFAVVGNHDLKGWSGDHGFAEILEQRLGRLSEARCEGEYGVKSLCAFRGLSFVLSGVGTLGTDHEAFLESALSASDAAFRVCIWHKNQRDMQVGAKTDQVGWDAYRICARHGVPIINGHEHSYARTQTLIAVGSKDAGHGAVGDPAKINLGPGRTFVVVSGLGGESKRKWTTDHASDSWWASIYAENYQLANRLVEERVPNIEYGALFVEFNVDGDPYTARGYFKTIDGAVHDSFTWRVAASGPN